MDMTIQKRKAETLLSLHTNGTLLILPNIWNPIGAKILEAEGYAAVATASSAVSASVGYDDGEKIRFSTLASIISRIAASVRVPVTADIEAVYGKAISQLEDTILQVIGAGFVGINIEDSLEEGGGLQSIDEQCERIANIRDVSGHGGLPLVINARVDSFVSGSFRSNQARIEEAVVRGRAHAEAGADCIYPMGAGDVDTLKELRDRIDSPLNVLVTRDAAPLTVVQEIGINRVSFGPYIFRSCLKKFVNIVHTLRDFGSYECFAEEMMS